MAASTDRSDLTFKRGDVVRLRSGGPSMTIDSLFGRGGTHGNPEDEPGANCVWIAEDGRTQFQGFYLYTLTK